MNNQIENSTDETWVSFVSEEDLQIIDANSSMNEWFPTVFWDKKEGENNECFTSYPKTFKTRKEALAYGYELKDMAIKQGYVKVRGQIFQSV